MGAVKALAKLCERVNQSSSPSCNHFWNLLAKVEAAGRKVFDGLPLVVSQMRTKRRCLSAVTLQVQLCEWRQFQNFQAKSKHDGRHAGSGKKVVKRKSSIAGISAQLKRLREMAMQGVKR